MSRAIGIDLGTSNSQGAVVEGGRPVAIPRADGSSVAYGKALPSIVAYLDDGSVLVGSLAVSQAVTNPANTILAAKRLMGRKHAEVEAERKRVQYSIVAGKNGEALIRIPALKRDILPQEVSAELLAAIKKDAETYLGCEVKEAVVTVPANFNNNQKQATKDAGAIAGLNVLRCIPEPTAAAIAYGLRRPGQTVLVFDLGGGTLDVSIVECGEELDFDVVVTKGDTQLGGTDMDNAVMQKLLAELQGVELDSVAMNRLREAVERAKCELSSKEQAEVTLPFLAAREGKPFNYTRTLFRKELESWVKPIINRCEPVVREALAHLKHSSLGAVILVGGPTRMPLVRELVQRWTGKEPAKGIDPMEVVALGAAVLADELSKPAGERTMLVMDAVPLTIGIKTHDGGLQPMIEAGRKYPCDSPDDQQHRLFSTAEDNQPRICISVWQGERLIAEENTHLGDVMLELPPGTKRGMPKIEVILSLDADGILHVSGTDLATGKKVEDRLHAGVKMDAALVTRLKAEAEARREQDELIVKAGQAVYSAETLLNEYADKLSEAAKASVSEALSPVKAALQAKNTASLADNLVLLEQAVSKAAEEMYAGQEK